MTGSATRMLATPLAAVACALSLLGLAGMVEQGAWMRATVVILSATAAVVVLARLVSRRPFLPTALGGLAALWLLLVTYVPSPSGGRSWLPTPGALARAWDVVGEAREYAMATVPPAPVVPELAGMIAAGAVLLFLAVDALAVGAGLAATSGLLLLVPWIPAIALGRQIPTVALAGAAAIWLALVALTRRRPASHWRTRAEEGAAPPPIATTLVAVTAAVGIGLVMAPVLIGGPGWGSLPRAAAPGAFGAASRLDLEIDLRDSLNDRSSDTILTYRSDSGRVDVLRSYTFDSFDGARWEPEETVPVVDATGVLWPEPFGGWVEQPNASMTVSIGTLADAHAPVPDAPRSISAPQGWAYSPTTDEVVVPDGRSTAGASYAVRYASAYHSPQALTGAEEAIAQGGDDAVAGTYRELDPRIDVARMTEVAQTVTGDASTRYARAVALQEYLRGPAFIYDTQVSPSGTDAVSTFLDDRRGYCVQFATAMVVLARAMDIPARLAVGFLGGSLDEDVFAVRGRDAHAWPELYFPGHGWVRFEPTPAQQTGSRPAYALPEEAPAAVPDVRDTVRPSASPSAEPRTPEPAATAPTVTVEQPAGSAWDPWAVVGLVVLAAGAASWLWMRRRQQPFDPERAWSRARDAFGASAAGEQLTPQETLAAILASAPDLDAGAADALEQLARAVEDHRYAPRGSAAGPEELESWLQRVTEARRGRRRAAHV